MLGLSSEKILDHCRGRLPSGISLRLLRNVFVDDEQDAGHWSELAETLAGSEIGREIYQLLPLLNKSGPAQEKSSVTWKKIKGIKRRTWCHNQVILGYLSPLLCDLQRSGVRNMLLGDAASVLSCYGGGSLREIHELAVLVDCEHSEVAGAVLEALGWRPRFALPKVDRFFLSGRRYGTACGRFELDLRWHVFTECCYPGADDDLWSAARPARHGRSATLMLQPADFLLYLCVRALEFPAGRSSLWMADVLALLETSRSDVDWDRLLEQANKRRLVLPVKTTLEYLNENFGPGIPSTVIRDLRETRVSLTERLESRYGRWNCRDMILGNLPVLYFDFVRSPKGGGAAGFARYLKTYWGVRTYRELAAIISRLSRRRLKARLRRSPT